MSSWTPTAFAIEIVHQDLPALEQAAEDGKETISPQELARFPRAAVGVTAEDVPRRGGFQARQRPVAAVGLGRAASRAGGRGAVDAGAPLGGDWRRWSRTCFASGSWVS